MLEKSLENQINNLWEGKTSDTSCIKTVMQDLNSGKIRVVEKTSDGYVVDQTAKKAILLYFRHTKAHVMDFGGTACFDKVPLKTDNWTEQDFINSGFRAVPGAIIRYGAHISPSVVVMQSFVNVGAYVGEGTMLDTYSLVGSCAQIGKNCHISASVSIGGVLEPLQANPVIIEDNCFIGVGSSVTEGVIVKEGAVISAGVALTASTKIVNRATGEISYGCVPPYSVVVPGTIAVSQENAKQGLAMAASEAVSATMGGGAMANGQSPTDNTPLTAMDALVFALAENAVSPANQLSLACAVIVKQCDAETRKKTSINELLRF